ncbi:DUF885 domain-containing protein [Chiayiivirga flava]|uniref:Uncharacterized protein (DUF885 family) n=1 Tax=Chiayiivirga flava TaxID=659595 RepID=A0A7W8FY84_9GAMM|nr:DUF885 domain-containing protein [Chiayiivirga flava]MBB5206841.1 uncharacterized protein (DUF885 family) [Chiayiivirga flava]
MRTALRWSVRLLLLVLLLAALLLVNLIWFKPVSIRVFFERVFIEFAVDNPEMLSSMRMLPPWLDWYEDDLADASPAKEDETFAKLRDDYATLKRYDRADLDADTQVSYDMLDYFLGMQVEGERFRYHNYPLNQLFGVQNEMPTFMATQHQVRDASDAADYIARLDKFPLKFEQVLEGLAIREQRGILPPRFVVEKVLAEMRAFVAAAPQDNILYTSFVEKLLKIAPDVLPETEREQLKAGVAAAIERSVYPAYGTFIAYYDGLLPKLDGNHGVWALPDGEAYYAHEVRNHTTTDMTPAQVHALGLSEVARIEGEMDAILQAQGLVDGSVGARVQLIATRPDQLYPDTDAGRAQIIADFQAMIDEIDAGLGPYFNVRPKQGVTVERVPEFREKTAPGAYYNPPAFDGSRPGTFYINLRNTAEVARFAMRTLAYHEAIPGHHFQTTIQQELTGVPTFRKVLPFTAFSEGWALYAERLAWEIGFQDDPLDNLGRLQAEMFRAVRLVVDTGMHAKRWTREQAIAYMLEKTGMPETDVVAEIERYLVMPGQALAYKVGMNEILAQRERAKAELGEAFDLARFHDFVLTGGDMPLTLFKQRIDVWIAAQNAAAD